MRLDWRQVKARTAYGVLAPKVDITFGEFLSLVGFPKALDEQLSRTPPWRWVMPEVARGYIEPDVPLDLLRPKTRGDCIDGPRPCPWVSCRHHLLIKILESGQLRFPWGTEDPMDLPPDQSCALDVAERGGITLEEVGKLMGITRERVRQVEYEMLTRLRGKMRPLKR